MNKQLVTVITGGGRGIGKAIALRMAKETAVMLVGRTRADLSATCKQIEEGGGIADYCVGDVAREATADRCMRHIRNSGRTVINLVCNAGIGNGGNTHEFAPAAFARIMNVNVMGAYNFVHACLPDLITNRGAICMISSTLGLHGFKRQAAYVASKHALVGLAKSLALEYASRGITVVPICPTFVDTDMTRQTVTGLVKHQHLTEAAAINKIAETNPQKRIIPPEEVAEAVAFVCSGKCPAMNGNPFVMSGGN